MKILDAVSRAIMKLIEIACILFSLAMAVVITLQIAMRLMGSPLLWSEEIARIMMVWMVFLGAAYLYNLTSNGHIKVDLLHQLLPKTAMSVVAVFSNIIVFAVVAALIYYGFKLCAGSSRQLTTTALHIPFAYIYLAIPVSAAFMLFFSIRNLAYWVQKRMSAAGNAS